MMAHLATMAGRKFILKTDHKPLVVIFNPHKGISKMQENRLQRWAAFLSGYQYSIEHIKGKDNVVADYLSRAPIKASKQDEYNDKKVSYLYFIS